MKTNNLTYKVNKADKPKMDRYKINSCVKLMENVKTYFNLVIEANRPDVYDYVLKRDKLGKRLTIESANDAISFLVNTYNNTSFKNAIWDKNIMGLGVMDSICAVSCSIDATFKTNIPKFETFLNKAN